MPCPMPDCGEGLYVVWTMDYALNSGDTAAPQQIDAHTHTWHVECSAGHKVLLPAPPGCPEYDHSGECPHGDDAHDWHEELATLRDADMRRLRDLIARLAVS